MQKVKMILTNRFDPDVRVYKEAKYLVSQGYDVEILSWDRENEYKDKEVEELEGVKVKRFFPYAKYGTGIKQLISYIRFIKEIGEYLKGVDYEYLHCHDLDGVLAGNFIKRKSSKLVFDMHEYYEAQGSKQKIRYIVRWIVKYLQRKSDYIIYVSDLQKSTMNKIDIKKLIFLPNYPLISDYKGSNKQKSEKLRISYIGAVRQFEELRNLMEACKGLEDVEVSVHGAGTAYNRLNEIKSNYSNVNVTGLYHFLDSAKLYSETDILYTMYPMSSIQYKRSYPVKFFEAIITKTPLIVSKGSILEEFLKEHDIGFAVDGTNIEEIKELINYINNNRNILKEKTKNLEKIQYNYSWDKLVKNLDVVYKL